MNVVGFGSSQIRGRPAEGKLAEKQGHIGWSRGLWGGIAHLYTKTDSNTRKRQRIDPLVLSSIACEQSSKHVKLWCVAPQQYLCLFLQ